MILLPQLSRFQTCECLDWSLCHLRACQDQHLSAHARWQPETAARALRVEQVDETALVPVPFDFTESAAIGCLPMKPQVATSPLRLSLPY